MPDISHPNTMKLIHLILLAFVSVGIAASSNQFDDTEDLTVDDEKSPAVHFPGVVIDDDMMDDDVLPDLTRTACTCAGSYHRYRSPSMRAHCFDVSGRLRPAI
jgi:hypothetical protein